MTTVRKSQKNVPNPVGAAPVSLSFPCGAGKSYETWVSLVLALDESHHIARTPLSLQKMGRKTRSK